MHNIYYSLSSLYRLVTNYYYCAPVNGFTASLKTPTTAGLTWNRTSGVQYYDISVANLNTSLPETHYLADHTATSAVISSLHPNHLYHFSISAFTVAMGPSISQTILTPENGNTNILVLSLTI